MKRRFKNNRYYEVKKIQYRHREISRLLLIGLKDKEIAESLDITTQTVRNTKNNPVIKAQLDLMVGARDVEAIDVAKRIQKIAPDAIEFLETVLSGKVPLAKIDTEIEEKVSIKQRVDVAFHGLGLAGYSPIKRTIDMGNTLSKEDINTLKERASKVRKFNKIMDNVEDADVTDIVPPEDTLPVTQHASSIGG